MRIVHVTTFVYPVPKTHTLPMPQSLDSYSGWDIEKNNACEIQNGTRYQIAYAASEQPSSYPAADLDRPIGIALQQVVVSGTVDR